MSRVSCTCCLFPSQAPHSRLLAWCQHQRLGHDNFNTPLDPVIAAGSFLAVPAGVHKASADAPPRNATYLFARGAWGAPAAHLPSPSKPVVAVRFCPLLFAPSAKGGSAGAGAGCFGLPYRLVFAVATLDSVMVYDTEVRVGWLASLSHCAAACRVRTCSRPLSCGWRVQWLNAMYW